MGRHQRVTVEQDGWVSSGKVSRSQMPPASFVLPSWRVGGGTDDVVTRRGSSPYMDLALQTNQPHAVPEVPLGYVAAGEVHRLEFDGALAEGSATSASLSLRRSYLAFGRGKEAARIEANSLPTFIPGARFDGGWYGGIAHDYLSNALNLSRGSYTGFGPDGEVWTVDFFAVPSGSLIPMTRRPTVHRVSPRELLAFIPGLQSSASGPRGSRFVSSMDNGRSWVYAYLGASILTDRAGYNPAQPDVWLSDAQVYEIRDRFVVSFLPSGVGIAVVGEGAYVTARGGLALRIYRLHQDGTSALLASDIEIAPQPCSTVHQHCGHHHGRPVLQYAREDTSEHILGFVKEDATGIDFVTMPRPSHQTGRVRALDETTLQCTMWAPEDDDSAAGYWIMVSDDFGQSWRRLRLIQPDDVGPPEILLGGVKVNHMLQAYADAYLPRANAQPSHTYPGAPWIGDDRIAQPWNEDTP